MLEKKLSPLRQIYNVKTCLVAYSLLRGNKKRQETPESLFGRRLLKVEIWRATVTYSPQDFASTTAVVEVT